MRSACRVNQIWMHQILIANISPDQGLASAGYAECEDRITLRFRRAILIVWHNCCVSIFRIINSWAAKHNQDAEEIVILL